ncbi:hypothetical protein GCM10009734_29260 [Nonomuraea bangladeshensis]
MRRVPAVRVDPFQAGSRGRLVSALPAGLGRAFLRLTTKSGRLCNSMSVDDHPVAPIGGASSDFESLQSLSAPSPAAGPATRPAGSRRE